MAEVTLSIAAKNLGISKQALHKHVKKGHITAKKVGSFYVVDEDQIRKELEEYLNRPGQNYASKFAPKEKHEEDNQIDTDEKIVPLETNVPEEEHLNDIASPDE